MKGTLATAAALALVAGCTSLETREAIQLHHDQNRVEADAIRRATADVQAQAKELQDSEFRCDYGSFRKRNGFDSYKECARHYGERLAALLDIGESRDEYVARNQALREPAYQQDRAQRDRIASDISRAMSSVAAEVSGAPVNIPTVRDDFFARSDAQFPGQGGAGAGGRAAGAAPTVDANSNHCIGKLTRDGYAWWHNRCDYPVEIRMCIAGDSSLAGCGQGPTYYPIVRTVEPGGTFTDDGALVQVAVCRSVGGSGFVAGGFDGQGGFRCVAG